MIFQKPFISKGTIYISFYVIVSAISHVFVNHTTRSVAPIVSLFYSSIFTILFFSIINLGELSENIVLIKKNFKSILWLNLFNAILWFVIFFSLKFLSPAVFACLFLGALPINLFILNLRKSKASLRSNSITGSLLLMIFLLMLLLVNQDIDNSNYFQILKYGTIVTIIGGLIAAFIMKISKELAVKNLTASLVVSLRFYGLMFLSFILIIKNPTEFLIKPTVFLELLVLALTSMALPLFLLQKALKTLNPLSTSITITTIPIVTYFLQLITGYYSFSLIKLIITILFSLSIITLAYLKKKHL